MKDFIIQELKENNLYNLTSHFKKNHTIQYFNIVSSTSFLNEYSPKFTERLYCILYNISSRPKCYCGNINKFIAITKGYNLYCSKKCKGNSIANQKNIKQTCLKKYGVENPFQSEKIKEKSRRTKKEKYGDPNFSNKIKYKKTCVKKYGVDNVSKLNKIRKKAVETTIKRYGKTLWESFSVKGKNEKYLLDEKEKEIGYKIDRDFRILQYFPDGYCHETNTIYEVYEKYHKYTKQMEKDIIRQKKIQDKLGCKFVIIKDGIF